MAGMRIAGLVAAAFVAAAGAVSCAGGAGSGGGEDAVSGGAGKSRAAPARSSGAARAAFGAVEPDGGAAGAATRLPTVGPSVIKTAEVEVELASSALQEAVGNAARVAQRYGGFVASTTTDTAGRRVGTVVIRVPAARFEQALADIEGLGEEVTNETVSGQDVSGEVVDLEARLRNWQSQEAVLLRLMDRSRSVADTIRVQGQLSQVQLEIERLRGRLSYLEDQTALGTITATFVGGAPAADKPGTLARAWEQAVAASLQVVAAVVVGAGFLVPIAILAAVIAVIVRGLRPRLTS